jgi:hypothetical protein
MTIKNYESAFLPEIFYEGDFEIRSAQRKEISQKCLKIFSAK